MRLKIKNSKSLALPSSTTHWDGRQAYVLELIHEEQDKYIFRKRNINTGEQIDNFYEIKDTLAHAVLIEGGSILE